jgi:8-oxo-dGTP pyrophosphatase MutT (NUDIX family)
VPALFHVAAKALLMSEGKRLVLEGTSHAGLPTWDVASGHLDSGIEGLMVAIARELREEIGCEIDLALGLSWARRQG